MVADLPHLRILAPGHLRRNRTIGRKRVDFYRVLLAKIDITKAAPAMRRTKKPGIDVRAGADIPAVGPRGGGADD